MLGAIDLHLPFWVAAGLSLANAAYGYFVLPESLPPENRKAFSWRRANPVGALVLLRSHPELSGLAMVHFLYTLAHNVLPSVFVLYTAYRYGWDERTIGLTMAGFGIAIIIVQGVIVKPAVARFGERKTLMLGLVSAVIGLTIYGIAPTGMVLWMGVPIAALWGAYGPASQGLMTRRVTPGEQGQLQGALSSILGITGMIGPLMFTLTFSRAISTPNPAWPGAPFLLAAVLVVGALVLAWRVTRPAAEPPAP
jgi:DHA1 family tetracycline resistance protein-like MFS transporter